jgi:plastocyanin
MKGELSYAQGSRRVRLFWVVFYIALAVVVAFGLYQAANHIRTHTLPVGQVQLSVPYSKYLVGEPITFTIKNNYNSPIYVANQCPAEPLDVYRQEAGVWVRLHDTATLSDCTDEQRQILVPPNAAVNGNFNAWRNLFSRPGKYRVVVFVEHYNALPYQDFEIITKPAPAPALAPISTTAPNSLSKATSTTQQTSPKPSSTNTGQAYTVHVNSSGIYDNTSLTLNAGDSITFIYSPLGQDEVRTNFTATSASTSISPITLDHETTSRTITLNNTGTWTFRADDHNGNTGTITVR